MTPRKIAELSESSQESESTDPDTKPKLES